MSGDYTTALREWQPRAEKGDAEAQYGLGYMYRQGQGVPKDSKEAGKWYEKAAEQGYVKAQVKLGLMYAKGDGFPQSYIQAHKWFNLAAAQGHKDSATARDKIAQIMSPAEIEEAISLSRKWQAGH
jgi:TPR repeat protein